MEDFILVDDRNYPNYTVFLIKEGKLKNVREITSNEYYKFSQIYWYLESFFISENRFHSNATCG